MIYMLCVILACQTVVKQMCYLHMYVFKPLLYMKKINAQKLVCTAVSNQTVASKMRISLKAFKIVLDFCFL